MSDDKSYTITYEGASPDYTDSTSISLDEFNPDPTSNVTFDVGPLMMVLIIGLPENSK